MLVRISLSMFASETIPNEKSAESIEGEIGIATPPKEPPPENEMTPLQGTEFQSGNNIVETKNELIPEETADLILDKNMETHHVQLPRSTKAPTKYWAQRYRLFSLFDRGIWTRRAGGRYP